MESKRFNIWNFVFYAILTICVFVGEYYFISNRFKEHQKDKKNIVISVSKELSQISNACGMIGNYIDEYGTSMEPKYLGILKEKIDKEYYFIDGVSYKNYDEDEKVICGKNNPYEKENINLESLSFNESNFYIVKGNNENELVAVLKDRQKDNKNKYMKVTININNMKRSMLSDTEISNYNIKILDRDGIKIGGDEVERKNRIETESIRVRSGAYYLQINCKTLYHIKEVLLTLTITIGIFIMYIIISYIFFIITKKNRNISELKAVSLQLSNEIEKRKEVEERYKLAIEASNDVIWEYRFDEGALRLSDNWKVILDDSQKIYRGNIFDCLKEICEEESYDDLFKIIDNMCNKELSSFKTIVKGKKVNGKNKWIYIKGKTVVDSSDNIVKIGGAIMDITENKNNEDKIKYLAYNDSLTGLKNSKKFNEDLEQAIDEAITNGVKGALLFLDLDNFKKVNDILGHDYGDKLLKEMGTTLCKSVDKKASIYRIAGDEFAIIINNIKSYEEIEKTAQDVVNAFKRGFDIFGKYIMTSVSLGVSVFPIDGITTVEIFKNADTAMYKAKEDGKGRYRFFDKMISEELIKKVDMENKIRKAIKKKEFAVYYQPKINVKSNSIDGFEALLRWYSSEYDRWVSPMEFIPVAEEGGFVSELGILVIEEVCKQINVWKSKNIEVKKIAINISPIQLNKDNLKENLFKVLKAYKVPPEVIEVEITETAVMHNLENNIRILKDLINSGISIALDDFGTGYSSLSYLINLPINVLKIDRCFIKDIDENSLSKGLVEAIIKLSHDINLKVVAEGVEKESELNVLKDINCDVMQGYYFSKPMPKEEVEIFIKNFEIEIK